MNRDIEVAMEYPGAVHFTGSGKPQCVIGPTVAGAMKIAPFALGLVYFTKWRWRPVLLCGVLSLVFMFLPWAFCRDGFAALPVMIKNAAEHSQYVLRASDIGLVQLWRTVRLVLGQDVQNVWPGMKLVAVTSQLIGAAALIYGVLRRDKLLMVGGMLWAAGNMYYYAMLYVFPVFVLEFRGRGSVVRSRNRPLWVGATHREATKPSGASAEYAGVRS